MTPHPFFGMVKDGEKLATLGAGPTHLVGVTGPDIHLSVLRIQFHPVHGPRLNHAQQVTIEFGVLHYPSPTTGRVMRHLNYPRKTRENRISRGVRHPINGTLDNRGPDGQGSPVRPLVLRPSTPKTVQGGVQLIERDPRRTFPLFRPFHETIRGGFIRRDHSPSPTQQREGVAPATDMACWHTRQTMAGVRSSRTAMAKCHLASCPQ